jgi:hypothetical protein
MRRSSSSPFSRAPGSFPGSGLCSSRSSWRCFSTSRSSGPRRSLGDLFRSVSKSTLDYVFHHTLDVAEVFVLVYLIFLFIGSERLPDRWIARSMALPPALPDGCAARERFAPASRGCLGPESSSLDRPRSPLKRRFSRVGAESLRVRPPPGFVVPSVRRRSEAVDVDHGQLVYPSLKDVAVVMSGVFCSRRSSLPCRDRRPHARQQRRRTACRRRDEIGEPVEEPKR